MHGPNIVVDVRNILTEILQSWKRVIVLTVLFAIVATGISYVSATNSPGEASETRDRIAQMEAAESYLTTKEIDSVKSLLEQVNSYERYRKIWQDEFSEYMDVYDEEGEDQLIKKTSYRLSSSVDGADSIMSNLSMSVDDYKKIVDILPDVDTISSAYKYVSVWTSKNDMVTAANFGEADVTSPYQILVYTEVLGKTQKECDEIEKIVDSALRRELKALRAIDKEAKLTQIDSQYQGNINSYIAKKQQNHFDMLQKLDTAINYLRANCYGKMTNTQKLYYNLLNDEEKGSLAVEEDGSVDEVEVSTGVSINITPKYIIIVLLVCFLLSCVCVAIGHLMSSKVKSANELEIGYGVSVLNTFFLRSSGFCPFRGVIRRLYHADTFTQESTAAMVAADVCGSVKAKGNNSVFLIETCDCGEDRIVTGSIENAIRKSPESCSVSSGVPLQNAEDVWEMTKQRNSLLVVHTKKTTLGDVEKLLDLCRRHSITVLGAVVITDF